MTMTASEVFEAVTGSGSSDFAMLVAILNRRGAWCLIDGLAVNCYVEPVYTLDAYIVVAASELSEIKGDLINAGFSVEEFPHSLNATMPKSDLPGFCEEHQNPGGSGSAGAGGFT